MKKILYIAVLLSSAAYAIEQAVIISACRQGTSQVIWTGEGVTTWPILSGITKDPHNPNKYLVTFQQMKKADRGVQTNTFTQGSDGTLYKIENGQPVPIGDNNTNFIQSTSPLYRMKKATDIPEPNR